MFDAFGVESDQTTLTHVEGDDGTWVGDDEVPEWSVLVVGMFDDEDSVGCGCVCHFFVSCVCHVAFLVDYDEGLVAVVVADAVELLLEWGGEVLFPIGIVG